MLTKTTKTKFRSIFKWVCVSLIILICFSIMTTGGPGKAKPILLLPVVIAVAMSENELVAGIIGAVCGMLTDLALGKFLGVNAMLFLIFGVLASFLFLNLVKRNFINTVLLTAIAAVIHGLLDFFFFYVIWGYEDLSVVFLHITLLSALYTVISSAVLYFVVTKTIGLFTEKEGLKTDTNMKQ